MVLTFICIWQSKLFLKLRLMLKFNAYMCSRYMFFVSILFTVLLIPMQYTYNKAKCFNCKAIHISWAESVIKVKIIFYLKCLNSDREAQRASCPLETEGPSNCLSSIWTPKTWSFYSLCFPCFSPFLISFCSASNSLHPSELREGWCVFTFWTQHKTEINSFVCHNKKHLRNI